MKKNKTLMIVLPIAIVLVLAIAAVAVIFIMRQNRQDKYQDQMKSADQYLIAGDYENLIVTYKAAIDLQPQKPEPYIGLAQVYIERGQLVDAEDIAKKGYTETGDERLLTLMNEIDDLRLTPNTAQGNTASDEILSGALTSQTGGVIYAGSDNEGLAFKASTLEMLTSYCYQEFVNSFGQGSAMPAGDDGFAFTFKGLNATLYFKNLPGFNNLVDEQTRTPVPQAKPFKILITQPSTMFLNFESFISFDKLSAMIPNLTAPVLDEETGSYFVTTPGTDYVLYMETDAAGNIFKQDAMIQILISDPIKEEYINDESRTFVLGSHVYPYEVPSIVIEGEDLGSISPLENCTALTELSLTDCTFDDLSPLSGLNTLQILVLDYSRGFRNLQVIGRTNISLLSIRGCTQLNDLSGIQNMLLYTLDLTGSGVSYEDAYQYKKDHVYCTVYFDGKELTLTQEGTADPSNVPEGYFMLGSQMFSYDEESIYVSGERIDDMSGLANCKKLKDLTLVSCSFDTLEPVAGCESLQTIQLTGSSGFTDLSPLSGLKYLSAVVVHGCSQISNIDPLDNMSLTYLDLCFTSVGYDRAYSYKQAHPDCVVYWDNKQVTLD